VVDAEVCEGRDHRGGVEVVEEAGDVEEENSSDIPASDGGLRFITEEGGSIRCGVVLPRPELHGANEGVVPLIGPEAISDDFF
jgi:hypothetical protein